MNKSEKIRLIYGICLSVFTAIVGIVFIVQIADLYYTGLEQVAQDPSATIYSLDNLKAHILLPVILLCIWVAAVIGGFVLSVVIPINSVKRSQTDDRKILIKLKEHLPQQGSKDGFDEAKKKILFHERARIVVWACTLVVLIVCASFILAYAYNPANYGGASTWKEDILRLVRYVIGFAGGGFVVACAAVIFHSISVKREVAYVKTAIATGDRTSVKKKEPLPKNAKIALIAVAGGLILLGVLLYILAPIIFTAVTKIPAGNIVILAFVIFGLAVAGYAAYRIVKRYIPEMATQIMIFASRIVIGVTAVVFIIVGAFNGGAEDVLTKAINICTECIGLG